MKTELIQLSKELGFKALSQPLQSATLAKIGQLEESIADLSYYLWMCELQKWLRDVHKVIVTVDPIVGFSECNYSYNIYTKNNIWILSHFTARTFSSPEETLQEGLYHALTLIKNAS